MKRTPIKRGKPLKRRSRLPSRNAARAKKLRARNFSGPAHWRSRHDRWVALLGCLVFPRKEQHWEFCRDIEPAHVKSRGAGGTYRDLVPLCHEHHAEQHRIGIKSFEAKYGLDLRAEAARLVCEHEEEESR